MDCTSDGVNMISNTWRLLVDFFSILLHFTCQIYKFLLTDFRFESHDITITVARGWNWFTINKSWLSECLYPTKCSRCPSYFFISAPQMAWVCHRAAHTETTRLIWPCNLLLTGDSKCNFRTLSGNLRHFTFIFKMSNDPSLIINNLLSRQVRCSL